MNALKILNPSNSINPVKPMNRILASALLALIATTALCACADLRWLERVITIPDAFRASLEDIVGRPRVLTGDRPTLPYRKGFRTGQGGALAVVQPRTLVEMWRVLAECVAANKVVILQAANTGLTGGSTPDGEDYDGDVIIISTLLMRKIFVIDQGRQVICLAGATLHQLERVLAPLGREPHSVIGSSSRSLSASRNLTMATAVKSLVIDATR